jgi:arginase
MAVTRSRDYDFSMTKIAAVVVPYELGRFREVVGRGPERLLELGAVEALASSGASVRTEVVELDDRYRATGLGEGDAAFELIRLVADSVRGAREEGAFPVVLSGSCFAAAVGVVAGLDETALGVVYLDAHADFCEPATTTSGYFDSMGLAVLTGSAWQTLLTTVPGARPLPESAVVLAGARSFTEPPDAEEDRLAASHVVHLTVDQLRSPEALIDAVGGLVPEIMGLYVHVDLDVLDEAVATANVYSAPDGVNGDQLNDLLDGLLRMFPVRAVSLTCYDPAFDVEGRVPPIALRLLTAIARSL